jgi:hypothetical protein
MAEAGITAWDAVSKVMCLRADRRIGSVVDLLFVD